MRNKIVITLLALLVTGLTMNVNAKAPAAKSQGERNLASLIKKNIVNASKDFHTTGDAIVRVSFTVNKEGKINILDYNSSDTNLFNYVKKQLQREALYNADDLENKMFCYEFKFVKE